jgi:hypothetical protein
MVGGQATEQGDCSKFKSHIPHCCKRDPEIVDLLPGTPYNMQVANCCKGGVLSAWAQDPEHAVASFQVSVGQAGTTNKTVRVPKNFTLKAPGPGYTCGPAKLVKPTKFVAQDGRRFTQALSKFIFSSSNQSACKNLSRIRVKLISCFLCAVTWNVTCTYSQFVAQRSPTCCVSLSSFYNDTIVNCPTCSCGCLNNSSAPGSCVE